MADTVTVQKLKDDLAAVMRDAESLLAASASHGGERMDAAKAKIRESLDAAKARVREAEVHARQQGEAAVHATEDYTRHHPWQALGIAASVGLVIGVLLARR
jgi:ElaB/YqjD/DUF883 family membrane-anchored ribosome-binding protein